MGRSPTDHIYWLYLYITPMNHATGQNKFDITMVQHINADFKKLMTHGQNINPGLIHFYCIVDMPWYNKLKKKKIP